MTRTRRTLLVVALASFASAGQAQEAPKPNPAKVLRILQEMVKPGKNAAHANHETGWPLAYAKAGGTSYWFGLVSMTGANDALYITAFPSLAAYEKSAEWAEKAPGLQATIDKLWEKDADFLTGTRAMIATAMENLTVGTPNDLSKVRGFLIRTNRVRIGYGNDYAEYMTLVKEGYRRAVIDPHIVTYSVTAGVPVPTYITFRGFRSLAEMDEWPAMSDKMRAALSQEQRDRMDKISKEVFTARDGEIYSISPKMSYVSKETRDGDPEFWKANPVSVAENARKSAVAQAGAPRVEKKP